MSLTKVFVEWTDSATHSDGWEELDEIRKTIDEQGALDCYSVGWQIHETDSAITLATTWSPDYRGEPARVQGSITIPKVCITKQGKL